MTPDDELQLDDEKEPLDDNEEVSDEIEQGDGDADAAKGQDGDTDDEAGEEGEGQSSQVKPKGNRAYGELRAAARENKARADRLEREMSELRRDREADRQRTQQETPEQEAARLAMMSPEERIDYKLDKATRQNERFMAQQQFIAADSADQLQYKTKALTDPRFAKYAPEVEAGLAEARKAGGNPSREVVLRYILGDKLLAGSKKAESTKKAAADSVKRQTTSPSSSKGDLGSSGRKPTSLAKRLENIAL